MRLILVVLAAVWLAAGAARADEGDAWLVRCGGPFQTCGYVEGPDEAVRIPFRFEAAEPFSEELAAVRVEGQWGFINRAGELVIQPAYDGVSSFQGGYAEVRRVETAGIIDRHGRAVVPFEFARIVPFSGDVFVAAPAGPGRGGLYTTIPGRLTDFGMAGLYHRRRGWLTGQNLFFSTFGEDRPLIWAREQTEDRQEIWGLMRADGSWQVTPRYSYVQPLIGDRAVVRSLPDLSLPWRDRQASILNGAVDEDGRLVVPLEFGHLTYWRGGYGIARRVAGRYDSQPPGNQGLLAHGGTLVGGRWFDEVSVDETSGVARVRIGDVWQGIQADGALIPDPEAGTVLASCPDGLTFLRRGEMIEALRHDGVSVGLFEDTYVRSRECPGPFSLRRAGHWFLLMPDGEVLGGERGFENAYGFQGSTSAIQLDGQWGLINRRGEIVVRPQYQALAPVGQATYRFERDGVIGWINDTGQTVAEPRHRPDPVTALDCEGGLSRFQHNGLWGMRDANERVIIPARYRAILCFQQGSAWAVLPEATEWCPIGPDGEHVRAFRCRREVYSSMVSNHSPERFSDDDFESSVLWSRAELDHLAGARDDPPHWLRVRDWWETVIMGPARPVRVDANAEPDHPILPPVGSDQGTPPATAPALPPPSPPTAPDPAAGTGGGRRP